MATKSADALVRHSHERLAEDRRLFCHFTYFCHRPTHSLTVTSGTNPDPPAKKKLCQVLCGRKAKKKSRCVLWCTDVLSIDVSVNLEGGKGEFGITMDEDILREAISHFLEDSSKVSISLTTSGHNNWVYFVQNSMHGDVKRYVLRIYNNNNDVDRIQREHEILEKLHVYEEEMNFSVPYSLPALYSLLVEDEATSSSSSDIIHHVKVSNGSFASMFHVIPGQFPNVKEQTCLYSLGLATGKLMSALQDIYTEVPLKDAACKLWSTELPPYYDLWNVHHSLISKERFNVWYNNVEALQSHREQGLDFLISKVFEMEEQLLQVQKENRLVNWLPYSFVHGDLVADNYLCDGDSEHVTGIIDFEFIGKDWRAMDLATSISKFTAEENPLYSLLSFSTGFKASGFVIEERERSVLPMLIKLRLVSNILYFCGRIMSGEADATCLLDRISDYRKRFVWLDGNSAPELVQQCFI